MLGCFTLLVIFVCSIPPLVPVFRFADVEPAESLQRIALYMHLCAGGQVERNDGELAVPLPIVHQVEEEGR